MEYPRPGSRVKCIATALILSGLGTCLNRTIIANFAPVYGAVAAQEAYYKSSNNYWASYISISLFLPASRLYDYVDWACYVTAAFLVLLWPLERLVLFQMSQYVTALEAVGYLTLVVSTAFTLFVRKALLDACPDSIRIRVIRGGQRWWEVCLSVIGLMYVVSKMWDMWDTALSWFMDYWTASSPASYTFVASLLPRGPLQVVIAVASLMYLPSMKDQHFKRYATYVAVGLPLLLSIPIATFTLRQSSFSILAHGESITGYISVVENSNTGLRILRNDHSILGGHWLLTAKRLKEGITTTESIYSVFYMLEAVRLIELGTNHRGGVEDQGDLEAVGGDDPKNALVIGLGIGTAPSALATHGINTTAIEIDPLVTIFAKEHFAVNNAVTIVGEDALVYANKALARRQKFDYIIHDVFTGGVEPTALFGANFLYDLQALLKPGGAIAINYAGNLKAMTTQRILWLISRVWKGNCRFFRDNAPPINLSPSATDFANIVTFCAPGAWGFREPVPADYLSSAGRRDALKPQHEIHLAFDEAAMRRPMPYGVSAYEHQQSAKEHWKIMRTVLPHAVWENW